MNNSRLVNQDSGNVEWYTPSWLLDAARRVMGGIDLDPASTPLANGRVGAGTIYTAADNGLTKPWFGRVWMNHPYGRTANPLWIEKLVAEHVAGHVPVAMCVVFASTSEAWFKPLFAYPMCFLHGRVRFVREDGSVGGKATKGSVVVGLGVDVERFADEFGLFGNVMVPWTGSEWTFQVGGWT